MSFELKAKLTERKIILNFFFFFFFFELYYELVQGMPLRRLF